MLAECLGCEGIEVWAGIGKQMIDDRPVKIKRLQWLAMIRGIFFAGAAVLTVWFGLIDHFHMPFGLPRWLQGPGDIYLHSAAFATLTFIATLGRKKMFVALLLMAVLAIGLEAVQLLEPLRTANFSDLGASLSGVLIGWGAVWLMHRLFRVKV